MRIVYIWGLIAFALALTHATGCASDNVVRLGAPTSFSGKFAGNGDNMRKGYDLAVEAINAAGGVTIGDKSYRLAVQYHDDESTPARATWSRRQSYGRRSPSSRDRNNNLR
jgi:branched-chain amino acid transport system substrate-binding protein